MVKTMGDAVLMEFTEAQAALNAVHELSSSFANDCVALALPMSELRTGIHVGEVAKRRDGDLFGDAVNIANRLEGIAEPGQIVLSQAIVEKLDPELRFEELGEKSLKNVSEPVVCYAVRR